MKIKLFTYFTVVLLIGGNHLFAQDKNATSITKHISESNAAGLAEYFHSNIDLVLDDKDGTYSKAQAEMIVKNFFKSNSCESFLIKHEGSSKDGSKYLIGTYKTSSKIFRTYILLKKASGEHKIQQLHFEEE